MLLFVPFAIELPRKTLVTSRPLAHKQPLLVVAPYVPLQLVKVLPRPGTWQVNFAGHLHRLCDALVRTVHMFCFDSAIGPSSRSVKCGDDDALEMETGYGDSRVNGAASPRIDVGDSTVDENSAFDRELIAPPSPSELESNGSLSSEKKP